ncbi:hypothetical protein K5X82_08175 [Halosquirtibacter xylanolyticus]|uniref:lipocalin-like domain-containing protein n=1 Tax=Halosquirtibacter xylanolyticus TaxID=3374599 RepID=UPI00374A3237|nr:hypothetical protein K5X82_08175 [Prolixibacteraceae bacterium]
MGNTKKIFLDYDIQKGTHRSAEEEWSIHNTLSPNFTEWHYWTCIMEGSNGDRFFFFFCDFNMDSDVMKGYIQELDPSFDPPEDQLVFMGQTLLSNYSRDHYFSDVDIAIMDPKDAFDKTNNTKHFKSNRYQAELTYKDGQVVIKAKGPNYDVELFATGADKVMWAKDNLGKEGFIRQGAEDDRSFYYSLPDLPFHGKLSYTIDGESLSTEVTGRGWIDKQWGDFRTKAWEWSSMRFADGDRINLYNFEGGYQVGTYQKHNGECEYFDNFTVFQKGYAKTPDNVWFSHGWEYELPVKGKVYCVEPLSDKNIMIAPGNSFFEGLGKLMDKEGNQVGWCVNESMDVRVMENEPGGRFQNNKP